MKEEELPEGCIAEILSYAATPADVLNLSLVSKAFASAAEYDTVWDRFIPSDLSSFLPSSSIPSSTSKKALYHALSDNPTIIDQEFSIGEEEWEEVFHAFRQRSPHYMGWHFSILEVDKLATVQLINLPTSPLFSPEISPGIVPKIQGYLLVSYYLFYAFFLRQVSSFSAVVGPYHWAICLCTGTSLQFGRAIRLTTRRAIRLTIGRAIRLIIGRVVRLPLDKLSDLPLDELSDLSLDELSNLSLDELSDLSLNELSNLSL
ncbi:hypothetical protein DEO72_LG9g2512 [Vigna unguiculata]|uniref:F-box domain-containing protein n=1 Tax=Vigna unguiculata TaxID=3917 RepID=A0A4D6N3H8_VIGUN|nr:hypothetical protein DEO72_LG9g2512 [Vigna unguiculata]